MSAVIDGWMSDGRHGIVRVESCVHDHHWFVSTAPCSHNDTPVRELLPLGLRWFVCDCRTHSSELVGKPCRRPYRMRDLPAVILALKLAGHAFRS